MTEAKFPEALSQTFITLHNYYFNLSTKYIIKQIGRPTFTGRVYPNITSLSEMKISFFHFSYSVLSCGGGVIEVEDHYIIQFPIFTLAYVRDG